MQAPSQPTPQQIQLQMQQRQQQQPSQQPQEITQTSQQISNQPGPPSNVPQSQQTPVSQQSVLQSHQPVSVSGSVPNVNPRITSGDVPMQSVSQSSITTSGTVSSVSSSVPPPQPPANQFNTASLCKLGQETVQEIVSKIQDTFQILRNITPPSGTPGGANVSNDKRMKLQEYLRTIRTLFKRLRIIYEKCNDNSQLQGMEYMHIESLIPVKEEWDIKTSEERKTSEAYRLASEECKELINQVIMKNAQLKEIIDHLRRIVWEINTMLTMRKS